MTVPAITFRNCTLTYGRRTAVRHLSGCFERGSLTAIVGPNGAGKSTLLKSIIGLQLPAEGRVECHGDRPRRELAYLPQRSEIDRSFPITVGDTVTTGLWHYIGAFGSVRPTHRRQITQALATVGLEELAQRPIGTLSGGQFQRMLFARLLLQSAPVVLLDEPFNGIDARTTEHLLGLVRNWHDEGRTVIAVLHDLEQVRCHFPRTLLLARQLIGWGATREVLTPANLLRMRQASDGWDENEALSDPGVS